MNRTMRFLSFIFCLAAVSYVGFSGYTYFFSDETPQIELDGVQNNEYYRGKINGLVKVKDGYKAAQVIIELDNHVLHQFRAWGKLLRSNFNLNTQDMLDGKHTLKITALSGSYNKASSTKEINFFVDNQPLHAALMNMGVDTRVGQGKTLHLKFQVNKKIKEATAHVFARNYSCFPEMHNSLIYECFLPISCEETPDNYDLKIAVQDCVGNNLELNHNFKVVETAFKKQQLKVSSEKLKHEKTNGANDTELEQELQLLLAQSPKQKLWHGHFYVPLDMQAVTTDFGTIRITQEKGKYMHKGVDLVAAPKSVVWAPQDGRVVLKNRYAMSGNTVAIDHGCGIFSLFFHLEDFSDSVELGKLVKKGNPVGRMGATGYATGYHLHWELRIDNTQVDPMQWTSLQF